MPPSVINPRPGRFRRVFGGLAAVGVVAAAGSVATGRYFRCCAGYRECRRP